MQILVGTLLGAQAPVVGASGGVFGLLLCYGLLFPNRQLMLLIPPIPIRARNFVLIYGGIELFWAFRDCNRRGTFRPSRRHARRLADAAPLPRRPPALTRCGRLSGSTRRGRAPWRGTWPRRQTGAAPRHPRHPRDRRRVYAATDLDEGLVEPVRQGERLDGVLGHALEIALLTQFRQQDHEFVAAESGTGIFIAKQVQQPVGDLPQQFVPGGMAELSLTGLKRSRSMNSTPPWSPHDASGAASVRGGPSAAHDSAGRSGHRNWLAARPCRRGACVRCIDEQHHEVADAPPASARQLIR